MSHACSITDPDGEPQTYLIQNSDDTIRQTIFEKLENKVSLKILAVCVNCFEEEFIWPVSQSATGQSKSWMASGRRAVEMAQKEWVRITWKDMANGYLCTRPINQEKYGEPSWSKLSDEELINFAYDGRIITDPDHEAIRRHLGGIMAKGYPTNKKPKYQIPTTPGQVLKRIMNDLSKVRKRAKEEYAANAEIGNDP